MEFVIFDMDGTIVEFNLPIDKIKRILGVKRYILEEILERENRNELLKILEEFEIKAATESRLYEGVKEYINFLKENNVLTAIYTRNSKKSVEINLNKHELEFDYVFTREHAIKPSPKPILDVIEEKGLSRDRCVMIGDFKFDYLTAKNAGIKFWLFLNGKNRDYLKEIPAEMTFECYSDLLAKTRRILNDRLGLLA